MQAVIAIPDTHTLNQHGGPAEALLREVCGVPLLVRVIKTAVRAGANSLLVIWPSDVPQSIWLSAQCGSHRPRMLVRESSSSSPRNLSLDRTRTGRRSHRTGGRPVSVASLELGDK